jgi:hypothetical protein
MIWSELEAAAPALAEAARARFEGTHVAMLGTIRADGSPRVSPIEPYFTPDNLLFGAMARSAKARDLERDRRCAFHSAIADPNGGDPEFKLYGTAIDTDETPPTDAWWLSYPPEMAHVFALDVEEAVWVDWQLERGEMTVTRWSPARGLEQRVQTYP